MEPLMGTVTSWPPYTSVLLKPNVFWKMQDLPVYEAAVSCFREQLPVRNTTELLVS